MPRTGPRTPAGKAIAGRNAVKHGLRAMTLVIPGLEDERDWRTFHAGVVDYYDPVGTVEYALVDRAAGLLWRLRRAARAEREAAMVPQDDTVANGGLSGEALEMVRELASMFSAPPQADQSAEEWEEEGRRRDRERAERLRRRPKPPPRILPDAMQLLALSRYESRLNFQLRHTLREIERCQLTRRLRERYLSPQFDEQGDTKTVPNEIPDILLPSGASDDNPT